ncbi:hypothetical protein POUND7_001338 [Theobroma cacao]
MPQAKGSGVALRSQFAYTTKLGLCFFLPFTSPQPNRKDFMLISILHYFCESLLHEFIHASIVLFVWVYARLCLGLLSVLLAGVRVGDDSLDSRVE